MFHPPPLYFIPMKSVGSGVTGFSICMGVTKISPFQRKLSRVLKLPLLDICLVGDFKHLEIA